MREIKFRGKCTPEFTHPTVKWVYGSLVSDSKKKGKTVLILVHLPVPTRDGNTFWYEVYADTVGQYTGLRDADGREIYEGDIVKATLKEPSFVKRFRLQNEIVGEVVFDNAWWIKECETVNLIPPWRLRYYDLTVIGNIHDNPELLEAKDA